MNKYNIAELNGEYTYLELRILTYLECELKMKKITDILMFLEQHNFIAHLTKVHYFNIKSENYRERQNVPSLTIDLQDDKFRFKYWDGSKTYWTYHTQDLFKTLIQGRIDFGRLIDKYQPITDLLFEIKNQKSEIIKWVRYKYYPNSNTDILYELEFRSHIKDTQLVDNILKEIYNRINELNLTDLSMDIDYSYSDECLPCQKAKEKNNAN